MRDNTDFRAVPWPTSILVIGCGLMGASFALAVQQARPEISIVGVDPSEHHRTTARSLKAFIQTFTELDTALTATHPDLVVLAAPVDATVSLLTELQTTDCAIMDICSVKVPVCDAARQLQLKSRFAPTHPMAGMATEGPAQATAGLFADKPWILINDWPMCDRLVPLIQDIGARPIFVDTPESHDQAMAAVSHTVHLVSLAAMQAFSDSQTDHEANWMSLTGPGFRDVTRLSGSAPGFWVSTLLCNAEAVIEQIDRVVDVLTGYQTSLLQGDREELRRRLAAANEAFLAWNSEHEA